MEVAGYSTFFVLLSKTIQEKVKGSTKYKINQTKEEIMLSKKLFLSLFCMAVVITVSGFTDQARCQEKYPTRAIDIIVPTGPGGSTDLTSRILAAELKKLWGVPVNVINKPGGNMVPAVQEVYNAKPDGYTLLGDCISAASTFPLVAPKDLPFKPGDRTYIVLTTASDFLLFVPASSPVKNLKDLEADLKKDPGSFTWPSGGGTSVPDVVIRQFAKVIGVDINKLKAVPATSGAQTITLAGSGSIKIMSFGTAMGVPNTQAGIIRPIATLSKTRIAEFADVPTAAEQGYPSLKYTWWNGISGPPNLPASIVDKWEKAVAELLKSPAVLDQLKKIGISPFYHNAKDTKTYVEQETDELAKVFK